MRCVDTGENPGDSSISISSRYVHPSEDAVLDAMSRGWLGSKLGTVQDSCNCQPQQEHATHWWVRRKVVEVTGIEPVIPAC